MKNNIAYSVLFKLTTVTLNILSCTLVIIPITRHITCTHKAVMYSWRSFVVFENGINGKIPERCPSNDPFLSLVLYLTPSGTFGVHFSTYLLISAAVLTQTPPRLNGKRLTIAEKLLPLIHLPIATVCSAVAEHYYLAVEWAVIEPGGAARTRGMSVCQICLLTSSGGQTVHKVTSFTFSVAATNISSSKAEADPMPEAEVAPACKFLP